MAMAYALWALVFWRRVLPYQPTHPSVIEL